MWVLIDNYDSFTHILHHYLLDTGNECLVFRNDALDIPALEALQPKRIIISPGPETPDKAGISPDIIARFHQQLPILGVCLGHQAIGVHFGAKLMHTPYPMHGKTSLIRHNRHWLFEGIPDRFEAMRYHSLCIDITRQQELVALAHAEDDGVLMALAHQRWPLTGLQFHPESIGTPEGKRIIRNWAEHDW